MSTVVPELLGTHQRACRVQPRDGVQLVSGGSWDTQTGVLRPTLPMPAPHCAQDESGQIPQLGQGLLGPLAGPS